MNHSIRVLRPVLVVACCCCYCISLASGADSLIVNGDFQKWTGDTLDGWDVEIGAKNGAGEPKSEVKLITGPALMLRGDAATMAWHSVGQEIAVRPGSGYRLDFETRTKDVRQQGHQFNNCYVGVMFLDGNGKPVGRETRDVSGDTTDWTKHQVNFIVPKDAASTKVIIFLSKSGTLGVRNVAAIATGAAEQAMPKADDGPALVTNGDFGSWTDGVPDNWKTDIGASNGADQPKSEVRQLGDAGLTLRGTSATMAWHSVSQTLDLQKGKAYTLEFEAQAEDIRRVGKQFDNCYVGVMIFDSNGKRLGMSMEDLSRTARWRKQRIEFTVPANAAKTELLIFLSKSGTLSVRNVSVKEALQKRPFRGSRR